MNAQPVSAETTSTPQLNRTLGPLMLWGLGVGYVISGMYFGWNLGLPAGGTLGLAIATFFIIILYITFTFSYTELACAIPKAGGVFDYATRAMGKDIGFIVGMAQIIEFVFAPPAIAAAIGAYFHIFFPQFAVATIAVFAYILFTALNIYVSPFFSVLFSPLPPPNTTTTTTTKKITTTTTTTHITSPLPVRLWGHAIKQY